MDFKGTRGKWACRYDGNDYCYDIVSDYGLICSTMSAGIKDRYNALLISNAPETLEKLVEIVNILDVKCTDGCENKTWKGFQNGNGEDIGIEIDRFIKETKQLIKEATEL